jgi:hypothetical protein
MVSIGYIYIYYGYLSIYPRWVYLSCLVLSCFVSFYLILSHLTSPHLISSHLISPHLTSSHLISSHLSIYGYTYICICLASRLLMLILQLPRLSRWNNI